jgi:YidC/Oxa1 family membrane protein insertase
MFRFLPLAVILIFSAPLLAEGESTAVVQENSTSNIDWATLSADNGDEKVVVLGSVEQDSGYNFELQLSTKGASISSARLNGYFDRNEKEVPLTVLRPVKAFGGKEVLPLANCYLSFDGIEGRFPLDKLYWQAGNLHTGDDGSEMVSFTAILKTAVYGDLLKIVKTYAVAKDKHHFEIQITLKNLADVPISPRFELQSGVGFPLEDNRMDSRTIVAAFIDEKNPQSIKSGKWEFAKLRRNEVDYINSGLKEKLEKSIIKAPKGSNEFSWLATSNKYFTNILKPKTANGWTVTPSRAEYYDSKIVRGLKEKEQRKADSTESIGCKLCFSNITLAAAGSNGSSQSVNIISYLGPKKKDIFEKIPPYKQLHFIHVIDFKSCCGNLFRPLTFAILGFMNIAYKVIPNYGVVIIILVLLVRAALHPLTKKGQVSMSKMSKLGPKVEQIKKQYADNPQEMNKRVMELYKSQGASPMLGFMPMMIQMPIWISLYSAINASINLRSAQFLPFWITDLSAPDALFYFPAFTIPLVNITLDSFNLLPILLTVAMFMQQKMMTSTQAAPASPEMAQQQKIMQIMMPFMMLIFLYKAPSGLNLYIMASSFGSVIEQKIIKKHIDQQQNDGNGKVVIQGSKKAGKQKKKKPKMY